MKVVFETLKYAVLLEGTNLFSFTYHYDIVMVDDGKDALDLYMNISTLYATSPATKVQTFGLFWSDL